MKALQAISILIAGVIGVGSLAGCNDPRAVRPTQTRLARIDQYCALIRDRENEGPRRLRHTSDLISDQYDRDVAHLQRDLGYLDKWSRYDLRRWHDRQPRYRADLTDYFDGNLELANETVPHLFY